MDICIKSTHKQRDGATTLDSSDCEKPSYALDGTNLCLERGKVGTMKSEELEGSVSDSKEALSQLNVQPKQEQQQEMDDLFSILKGALNCLAGLESLTEDKEMKNPLKYEVSKPPQINKVTVQNNYLSESIDDVVESKILSEKSLRSAKYTEIAACANGQSLSTQKNPLHETCINSVSERSELVSNIKVESNELNEIATELLNLLTEDESTEGPTVSNDAVNTHQVALKSPLGQQLKEEERSSEDSSLTFEKENVERSSNSLISSLPTSVSAEVSGMVGNELLTIEPLANVTSVANNGIAINSTDVTRDKVRRSLRLNNASVGDALTELGASELLMNCGARQVVTGPVASMNVSTPYINAVTQRNTLKTLYEQLKCEIERQKVSSRGNTGTVSTDILNTLQISQKLLSGQQSIRQERSNEGSSMILKAKDAGRGSNTLMSSLPTSVSPEVMVGNERLTIEPVAFVTSVEMNDVAINTTDVTRDKVRRSLRLNSASVGDSVTELRASEFLKNLAQKAVTRSVVPMNVSTAPYMNVITPRNPLNTICGQPNFDIQRERDTSRANVVTYNAMEVGAPIHNSLQMANDATWVGKFRKRLGNLSQGVVQTAESNHVNSTIISNSFQPSTSSSNQLEEGNRTVNEGTLSAEQDVISIDSDSDDIQVVATVNRSSNGRQTGKHAICSLCGEEFPNGSGDLFLHMKMAHARYKRFKCEKCDRSFKQPHMLRRHVRNVHENSGKKNVVCWICDKQLKSEDILRGHIQRVHRKSENMATCPQCGKEMCRYSLNQHLQTHTLENAHLCSVCNKKFKTKDSLTRHMETHDETRITCKTCGKVVKKIRFTNHMRNHRVSSQCEICGAKLASAVLLKLHMSTHTGEQSFVCEQCGRKFARQYNLQTHLKLHAGIRKLVCDLCKRTFAQKWNLRTHMQSCHKSFLCNGD